MSAPTFFACVVALELIWLCIVMASWLELFQAFSGNLATLQRSVEEINDQASDLTNNSIAFSHHILSRLEDMNTRLVLLFF